VGDCIGENQPQGFQIAIESAGSHRPIPFGRPVFAIQKRNLPNRSAFEQPERGVDAVRPPDISSFLKVDRNRLQPHGGDLPETYGGGDISGGRGKMPKFLAELPQFFHGDAPMFGLEAFSVLLAQVFYDGEITAAFAPVQTFRHFRQDEMAGAAVLVDGNHAGRTGWSNISTKSRTDRGRQDWRICGRSLLIAIIRHEVAGLV
jgi:hypothetical protein